MIPVKTDYANIVFTAEGCEDLPGTLAVNENGFPEVETCWELSEEELAQVTQTRRIFLYTMGRGVPPMLLTTASQLAIGGDANEV